MYPVAARPRPVPSRPDHRTALAVVGDADPQHVGTLAHVMQVDPDPVGARVLDRVGEHLADREVRRRLHGRLRTPGQLHGHLGLDRQPQRQRPYGVAQSAFGEDGRVDAAHQVAQLRERVGGRPAGLRDELPGLLRVLVEQHLDRPEVHAHRHQPCLRPVVQIPLDSAQFGGRGVDGVPPGLRQHPYALGQFALVGAEDRPGEPEVGLEQARGVEVRQEEQSDAQGGGAERGRLVGDRHEAVPVRAARVREDPPQARRDREPLQRVEQQHGRQQRGEEPRRHVDRQPQQVPTGRRVGQHPEGAGPRVGVLRQRPVRGRDPHPAPLGRQDPPPVGERPYPRQHPRRRDDADADRYQCDGDEERTRQRTDPGRDTSASASPRTAAIPMPRALEPVPGPLFVSLVMPLSLAEPGAVVTGPGPRLRGWCQVHPEPRPRAPSPPPPDRGP